MKETTKEDLQRMRACLMLGCLRKDFENQCSNGSNESDNGNNPADNTTAELTDKATVFEVKPTFIGYMYAKFVLFKVLFRNKKRNYLIAIRGIG